MHGIALFFIFRREIHAPALDKPPSSDATKAAALQIQKQPQDLHQHKNGPQTMAGPEDTTLIVAADKKTGLPIAKTLQALGYKNLAFARDLNSTTSRLRSSPVGLLVVNQNEGSVLAFKILQTLRKAARYKTLPFVGMVGRDADRFVRAASGDRNAVFLTRPLSHGALDNAIKNLCNGASSGEDSTPDAPRQSGPAPLASRASATTHPRTVEGGMECLKELDGTQAKSIFEKVLKEQGPSSLAYMGLAGAFQLLGQMGGFRSALDRAAECAARENAGQTVRISSAAGDQANKTTGTAGANSEESADSDGKSGKAHGIWHKLTAKERRQKAFDNFNPAHDKRGSLRLFVPDWKVRHKELGIDLQAVDLSATGICFESYRPVPKKEDAFPMDLICRDEVVMTDVRVQVMRAEPATLGCRFPALTRPQEGELTHLLIEEQRKGANVADEFTKGKKEKKVIKLSF